MLRAFDLFDEIWAATAETTGFDRAAGVRVLTDRFGFSQAQAWMITVICSTRPAASTTCATLPSPRDDAHS